MILGLIVLIRTMLSTAIQIEIEGVLPWQRALLTSGAGDADQVRKATTRTKWRRFLIGGRDHSVQPTRSGLQESVGLGGPLRCGGVHGFRQGHRASGRVPADQDRPGARSVVPSSGSSTWATIVTDVRPTRPIAERTRYGSARWLIWPR